MDYEPVPVVSKEPIDSSTLDRQREYYNYNYEKGPVYIGEDSEAELAITSFCVSGRGNLIYNLLGFLTCGFAFLLGYYFPSWRYSITHRVCAEEIADTVRIRIRGDELEAEEFVPVWKHHFHLYSGGLLTHPTIGFTFRHHRYIFDKGSQSYHLVEYLVPSTGAAVAELARLGRHTDPIDVVQKRQVYGANEVAVPFHPLRVLVEQLLHPVYVFQALSILLWIMWEYYSYTVVIAVLSVGSLVMEFMEISSSAAKLQGMARNSAHVLCFRNGTDATPLANTELIPGDVIEITNASVVPCDLILLNGSCVVDESTLSGESSPVLKSGVLLAADETSAPNSYKHTLYSGTRVLQVREDVTSSKLLGLVVRTGYLTAKGQLIRTMQFPRPIRHNFYRDAYKFLTVLSILALIGIIYTLYLDLMVFHVPLFETLLRSGDLITIVVPPALPIVLTIGTYFAIRRLRHNQIYCSAPMRIFLAGKVTVVCFDKTGTLTTKAMHVGGVQAVADARLAVDTQPVRESPLELQRAMACCHGLRKISGEVIGDPLDSRIFLSTGADLCEIVDRQLQVTVLLPSGPTGVTPPPQLIVRRFEFLAKLRRMSVIVNDGTEKAPRLTIFCKGAAESVVPLCRPESTPPDWQQIADAHARNGKHVLAIAGRPLPPTADVISISRRDAEQNLQLLGFVLLENTLQPDTTLVVATLNNAMFPSCVITGDNPQTAIAVAKACHLLEPAAPVYLAELREAPANSNSSDVSASVFWRNIDNPADTLELLAVNTLPKFTDSLQKSQAPTGHVVLALTGPVFAFLQEKSLPVLFTVVARSRVFARVLPNQKAQIIDALQAMGHVVLMCGDGPNDVSALKAADVGLSVSQEEASITSPFTSVNATIQSLITVLREGRCALVTSFQSFKYMAAYSLIQFTAEMILYHINSMLGDYQFIFVDFVVIAPLALFISLSGPKNELTFIRPISSLIAPSVVFSLLGQVGLNFGFQFLALWYLKQQSWFVPLVPVKDQQNSYCMETTVLFLISTFQFIFVALAYNEASPFREPTYKNSVFSSSMVVLLGSMLYLVLMPDKFTAKLLDIYPLKVPFRFSLLAIAALNFLVCIAFEKLVIDYLLGQRGWGLWLASFSFYRRILGERDYQELQYSM